MKERDEPPLMLVHIPRVLVAGQVDIGGLVPLRYENDAGVDVQPSWA